MGGLWTVGVMMPTSRAAPRHSAIIGYTCFFPREVFLQVVVLSMARVICVEDEHAKHADHV